MFLREDNIAQGAIKINLLVDKLLVSFYEKCQTATVLTAVSSSGMQRRKPEGGSGGMQQDPAERQRQTFFPLVGASRFLLLKNT